MSFRKFNIVSELKKASKAVEAGVSPCSVCQGRLTALCAGRALESYKAERRETRKRTVRNDEVRWLEALYALKDPR